jgi:hypothetical protein
MRRAGSVALEASGRGQRPGAASQPGAGTRHLAKPCGFAAAADHGWQHLRDPAAAQAGQAVALSRSPFAAHQRGCHLPCLLRTLECRSCRRTTSCPALPQATQAAIRTARSRSPCSSEGGRQIANLQHFPCGAAGRQGLWHQDAVYARVLLRARDITRTRKQGKIDKQPNDDGNGMLHRSYRTSVSRTGAQPPDPVTPAGTPSPLPPEAPSPRPPRPPPPQPPSPPPADAVPSPAPAALAAASEAPIPQPPPPDTVPPPAKPIAAVPPSPASIPVPAALTEASKTPVPRGPPRPPPSPRRQTGAVLPAVQPSWPGLAWPGLTLILPGLA